MPIGPLLADRFDTFPCFATKFLLPSMCEKAGFISMRPSAPAAIRVASLASRARACSRSIATRRRLPEAMISSKSRRAASPSVQERFSRLAAAAEAHGFSGFDGIVLDIGLSSMQLDEPGRGFSFRSDGPLDMRMGREGPSAADLVNTMDEAELADILYHFGEERASRRIARAIVHDRATVPYTTTLALAQMIARVAPNRPTISIRRHDFPGPAHRGE